MLLVLSLMFPYLFGLGCCLLPLLKRLGGDVFSTHDGPDMRGVAVLILLGMVLDYFLVQSIGDLKRSLILGCLLSVIGYSALMSYLIKTSNKLVNISGLVIFTFLSISCIFIVVIEPIEGWEARHIWFLHGKMIYYNASMDAGGHWTLPSLGHFHSDYPKLISVLAAQIAFVAGYWNEYLPKLSLVALLVPAVAFLFSFLQKKTWHIPLIIVPLLFLNVWLKNGYVDGYLALYVGIGTFLWGRWLDKKENSDVFAAIVFTGISINLKNEGQLYAVIVAALLFAVLFSKSNSSWLVKRLANTGAMVLIPVSLSGFICWEFRKYSLGLKNDLKLGLESFERILNRIEDGSLYLILKHVFVFNNLNLSLGFLLSTLTWTLWRRRRLRFGFSFCLFVSLLYFSGITLIYLATPYDLVGFHLPTANRTMLPVHILLLAASYYIISEDEKVEKTRD